VVKVQAFVDANGNGQIDEFDITSVERTLTFIPASKVTTTTAITSAVIGTQVLKATVALGNDVNMANLGTAVSIKVLKNGDTVTVFKTTNVSYDSTDKVLKNLDTATGVNLGTETYTAQAYFGTVKLGSASNSVVPVAGTNVSVDAIDAVAVVASANTAVTGGVVRSGYTGNVSFKTTVKSAGAALKVAGLTVKVTLTKGAKFDAASTFVAGGKTLTATSGAVSFETTTDADGKVAFTGASSTGKKGDIVLVDVAVLGTSAFIAGAQSSITYTDAAASALKQTSLVGYQAVAKSTVGGTVKLAYTLVDQFGQAVTAGTYRASVATVDRRTSGTQINASALVTAVAGKFDVVLGDNSTKAGNYDVDVTVYKYDTVAAAWSSTVVATATTSVYVNAAAATTVTASVPSAAVATSTTAVSALDKRVDTNSAADLDWGTAYHTISGDVTDVTGARVAGAVVTVTGAGYGFYTDNVWTVGSATINADANGTYTVRVYSNVAGKGSVVVTSGAATKTVAVEYTGITTLDKKGTITLDVASLSQVGRSVTVGILVKDSLGNPVKTTDLVSVSVTGVGSLSAPKVSTDATGKATVQFIAGANDFGDAVIVAKYTIAGATSADDVVVSATKTLTVGVTDAQVDIVGKRVTAVASFTKGKTVALYVDGIKKWSKLSASDADVVLNYNLKKGTHTVTMKISGGFVTTEKFIVK
jgi:hypothetical protein